MTLALYGKSRKRRGALLAAALLSVLVAALGGTVLQNGLSAQATTNGPISGDGIVPIAKSDNPTCSSLDGAGQTWSGFKIDKGFSQLEGTWNTGAGNTSGGPTGGQVVISNVHLSGGQALFDWSSNFGVDAVFVKQGSDSSNLYVYDPPAEDTGDTGLGPKSGETNSNDISHVIFCYDPNPKVSLDKSKNSAGNNPSPGDSFQFYLDLDVENGPTTAATTLVDNVPADFTVTSVSVSDQENNPDKLTCTNSGNSVNCTLASGANSGDDYRVTINVTVVAQPSTCGNVTNNAELTGTNRDPNDYTGDETVNIKCARIIVKKVIAGAGADPDQLFPVTIDNTSTSHEGEASGNFSQNTPFNDVFESDNDGEPFQVIEGTLPGNWASGGWAFGTYANGVATCGTTFSGGQTASGGALADVDNGDAVVVCFKNTYTAPANGHLKVRKVAQAGSVSDATTFSGDVDSTHPAWGPILIGATSSTIDLAPGAHTVKEVPTATSGWTLVGYQVLNSDTQQCSTLAGDYSKDASDATSVNIVSNQTAVVCVMNNKQAEVVTQNVTFTKYICPNTNAIPPDPGTNIPVTPVAGGCTLATTPWTFNLGSTPSGSQLGTATTGAGGSVTITLNDAQLTQALKPYYSGGVYDGLWISEVQQAGVTFGRLRCYVDHFGGGTDNNDLINLPGAGTAGVHCVGYNIEVPRTITIQATKIVCDNEADLPDRVGQTPISSTTASAYVVAHSTCHLASGWDFQWGYSAGANIAQKIAGNSTAVGTAGQGWNNFSSSTNGSGVATAAALSTGATTTLWVREVFKPGYLAFSDDQSPPNASYSAELSCAVDGINYDNYDRIDGAVAGNSYYCVAWNVAARNVTIEKIVTNVANDPTEFPISMDTAGALGTISDDGLHVIHIQVDGAAHTLTETLPTGYAYDGKAFVASTGVCPAGPDPQSAGAPSLPAGTTDLKLCVYNHLKQGDLVVKKVNLGGPQGDTFTAHIDGGTGITFGQAGTSTVVNSGTHTVSEDSAAGYVAVGYAVLDPQDEGSCPETPTNLDSTYPIDVSGVSVADGETVTVCFYNNGMGHIRVVKVDGTASVPGRPAQWNFTASGPASFSNSNTIALGGGSYTIDAPVGNGYSVAETNGDLTQCPAVNETGAWRTQALNGPQDITVAGQTITFTFSNQPCQIIAGTGTLIIHKYNDLNGNHVLNAGETGLNNWRVNVQGPEFPLGQDFLTDASGTIVLPGLTDGAYTLIEENKASYAVVGVVNGNGSFSSGSSVGTGTVALNQTTTVDFYNQPRVNMKVVKLETDGSTTTAGQGWKMTINGCNFTDTHPTAGADGSYTWSDLAPCTYTVTEDTTSKAGFFALGGNTSQSVSATNAGQTYEVRFNNVKIVVPQCIGAGCITIQTTPTPTATPVTPTATPPTPTAITNIPPTATPTPVDVVLGERTPGPDAKSTPLAPSAGSGALGGSGGSVNMLMALAGLFALASGLTILGVGSRKRS